MGNKIPSLSTPEKGSSNNQVSLLKKALGKELFDSESNPFNTVQDLDDDEDVPLSPRTPVSFHRKARLFEVSFLRESPPNSPRKRKNSDPITPFDEEKTSVIPLSILNHILIFSDLKEIWSISSCCKVFNEAGNSKLFWEQYCLHYFNELSFEKHLFYEKIIEFTTFHIRNKKLKNTKISTWKRRFFKRYFYDRTEHFYKKKYETTTTQHLTLSEVMNNEIGRMVCREDPLGILIIGDDKIGKKTLLENIIKQHPSQSEKISSNFFMSEEEEEIGESKSTFEYSYKAKRSTETLIMEIYFKIMDINTMESWNDGGLPVCMICFSFDSKESLEKAKEHLKSKYMKSVLVGLKSDILESEREVKNSDVLECIEQISERSKSHVYEMGIKNQNILLDQPILGYVEVSQDKNIHKCIGLALDIGIRETRSKFKFLSDRKRLLLMDNDDDDESNNSNNEDAVDIEEEEEGEEN